MKDRFWISISGVDREEWIDFKRIANLHRTTASALIRQYMSGVITEAKKDTEISNFIDSD